MLLDRIKADRIGAMKERDEVRKNLLGTLLGAATKDSKAPDDETIVRTIRSFLKSLDETIGLVEGGAAAPASSGRKRRSSRATCRRPCPRQSSRPASPRSWPVCRSARRRPWDR